MRDPIFRNLATAIAPCTSGPASPQQAVVPGESRIDAISDGVDLLMTTRYLDWAATAPRSIVISAIEHVAVYEQARVLKSLGTTVIMIKPDHAGFVDGAAFSAHKLGGPRSCDSLYLDTSIRPLACGGGQESGIRPGTHNTPGAWAFAQSAISATHMLDTSMATARHLKELLISVVGSIPGASVIPNTHRSGDQRYSPYILSMAFPGLGGETMLRLLDEAGIAISTGAACFGSKKERRVFDAMGIEPSLSFASLRVSIGRSTDDHDIFAFLEIASAAYARYRL
jgi:cysteine sulfinate desulfinase/cysteine desulfurase-like protein